MSTWYFKRFLMEIPLATRDVGWPELPAGYQFLSWDPVLMDLHAEVKHRAFCDEVDAHVFSCFNDLDGCRRLMYEIARKRGFLAEATWLIAYTDPVSRQREYCGTIQGICQNSSGNIQNVGIVPEHRGLGLGKCLLLQAFQGFRHAGMHRVTLEVTVDNAAAVRLYQNVGFRIVRTLFKSAEVQCPACVGY